MADLTKTLSGLSALSQEKRLTAFRALMDAGKDGLQAGEIADALEIAPNKLSSHLAILVRSELVTVERQGRMMIYRADIDAVSELVKQLVETCCHGHPEVCEALGATMSNK